MMWKSGPKEKVVGAQYIALRKGWKEGVCACAVGEEGGP